MTAQKFTGIIVAPGSEHDGKRVSAKTPFHRLACRTDAPTIPRRGQGSVALKDTAMKVEDFVFISYRSGQDNFGVWVPDGRDDAWALQQLIAGYRRPV